MTTGPQVRAKRPDPEVNEALEQASEFWQETEVVPELPLMLLFRQTPETSQSTVTSPLPAFTVNAWQLVGPEHETLRVPEEPVIVEGEHEFCAAHEMLVAAPLLEPMLA